MYTAELIDLSARVQGNHWGSAGGLRRANQLASGSLLAASLSERDLVTAEPYEYRGNGSSSSGKDCK